MVNSPILYLLFIPLSSVQLNILFGGHNKKIIQLIKVYYLSYRLYKNRVFNLLLFFYWNFAGNILKETLKMLFMYINVYRSGTSFVWIFEVHIC